MSKHDFTSGPWSIRFGHDKDNYPYQIFSETGDNITTWGSIFRKAKAEGQNNAYLIASAPDMYEAMEEFVHRCEIGEVRSVKTYAKFKAILEKANGERK
jgi:hypothetical protein